jgi:hypothetical protein
VLDASEDGSPVDDDVDMHEALAATISGARQSVMYRCPSVEKDAFV